MLLEMLLRAMQPVPDTLAGRILRKLNRELRVSAELEARLEALRARKSTSKPQ